jgi:multidrug efflux system membrane fusion protein
LSSSAVRLRVPRGGGCQPERAPGGSSETPAVPVSRPVEREVRNFEDFTGQTDAVQVVDVRARVTGYLNRMPFKEGSEVKEGDLLFEIDPRPYQAQLDQALGQVDLNEASYELAKTIFQRDRSLAATGAVSQEQLDQDLAAVEEAAARMKAAKASTEVYKLNMEFTKVTSPIDGQVSRYYVTRGNLINQDSTLLTTIVSLDPMYAYFEMDEPSLLRIRRAIREGRMKLPEEGAMPVFMGLQGEDGYPRQGVINFFNNQINSATGSISLRGVFPNPKTAGARLLSPGMYVHIRLPIGDPHKALLVIDRAVRSDQGLKYVYVVDADDAVQYRRVTTGALQEDGLREVRDGLKPDEWVVVGALQQVRPRTKVQPDQTPMPTLAGGKGDAKTPAGGAVNPAGGEKQPILPRKPSGGRE